MDAEQLIRSVLDGTFTYLTPEGKVVTKPTGEVYSPTKIGGRPKGAKVKLRASHWTKEDEEDLIRLFKLREPIENICWILSRSRESIRQRLKIMRVNGRLQ